MILSSPSSLKMMSLCSAVFLVNSVNAAFISNTPSLVAKPHCSHRHPFTPANSFGVTKLQKTSTTTTSSIFSSPDDSSSDGPNWIEKSLPTGLGESSTLSSTSDMEEYDIGISGPSYQTGPLSQKMYDALLTAASKRFPPNTEIPSELLDVYMTYAMDMTAKEATKAALDTNGLDLAKEEIENSGEEGLWGDIDSVQLIDVDTGEIEEDSYSSFQEAVEKGDWIPGQTFSFVVRNVPASPKDIDISELLSALDPDGALRAEANEKGMTMPDEDVQSLLALGNDCERRCELSPREAENEATVFSGVEGVRGYRVMERSDLLKDSMNRDGTENRGTLMHTMDALVSHSCLIVDLSDGGTSYKTTLALSKMWDATSKFFQSIDENPELGTSVLPGMDVAEGAGSRHAVVGYANYAGGDMQFVETRFKRDTGEGQERVLVPQQVENILGSDAIQSIAQSYDTMVNVGKDVVRIAAAASSAEVAAFLERPSPDELQKAGYVEERDDMPFISGLSLEDAVTTGIVDEDADSDMNELIEVRDPTKEEITMASIRASEAAIRLTDELIDDSKPLASMDGLESTAVGEGSVSMTPHRLCRYSNTQPGKEQAVASEIFGAHTDTTFVTLVPAAAVSGLEVYDEDAAVWYRPELMARKHWEAERRERGEDPTALTETLQVNNDDDDTPTEVEIPWHARYVIVMPGELMQLISRNEIPGAVHRVVAAREGQSRLSAPVLLRARTGIKMNVERYFGDLDAAGPLLMECQGLPMEDLHDAMQPSSMKK